MRDRITLRQLRLLLVLNEARTASVAAQRLCISQPAVSKARVEIEAAIGAPIFVGAAIRPRQPPSASASSKRLARYSANWRQRARTLC